MTGLYTAADEGEMVRVLAEVFARQDRPAVAVGLLPAEFASFVRLLCPSAAVERLTVIARSSGAGGNSPTGSLYEHGGRRSALVAAPLQC